MRPLIGNDIESELSYAYLHAVASKIGAACKVGNRHEDNNGVDASLTAWAPFVNGGYIKEVDLKIQLKATIGAPVDNGRHLSYFLNGLNRYNDLRTDALAVHRILIVMFLPRDANEWLTISENELILKKCAYWVSLRGAAASANGTGETIYIPKTQIFNTDSLSDICAKLSRKETLNYVLP
jgi:Domain of unknown function (DUF4365)